MKRTAHVHVRPMVASDVDWLDEIDANFESPIYLDVIRKVDEFNVTWRLVKRRFESPFACTDFDFDDKERQNVARRMAAGDGLWLVAETVGTRPTSDRSTRLVGVVDVERQTWRQAAFVWNIATDRAFRGQGIGRELLENVAKWGRREGLRAVILETQSNNWLACRFYQHFGFQLTGIDDHYYTNHDIGNKEVALFWTYEL